MARPKKPKSTASEPTTQPTEPFPPAPTISNPSTPEASRIPEVKNKSAIKDTDPPTPEPPKPRDFESHYLSLVTTAFADDLDKLRQTPDFNEKSVPVLVQALRQAAGNFGEEERRVVLNGRR